MWPKNTPPSSEVPREILGHLGVDARIDHGAVGGPREISDFAVVGALLVVNAVLSFMQEHRAAGVVEALRRLGWRDVNGNGLGGLRRRRS